MIYLAVALGGALGALSRFRVGQWLADSGYAHLHLATFSVNVVGSLLIGIVFIWAERFNLSEAARLGISVGFLGAFTTQNHNRYQYRSNGHDLDPVNGSA